MSKQINIFETKKLIFFILAFGIFIRVFFLIYNASNPFGPAAADALIFHDLGLKFYCNLNWNEFNCDNKISFELKTGWIYSFFLGFLYFITFPSIIVGGMFSILFWLLGFFILKKFLKEFRVTNYNSYICYLIYTLFPSSVLLSISTLREIYQLVFFSLFLIFCIHYIKEKNIKYIFNILFCIICLTLLHWSFLISCTLILMLMIVILGIDKYNFRNINIFLFLLVGCGIIYFGWDYLYFIIKDFHYKFEIFFKDGLFNAIVKYRSGHNVSRATYYIVDNSDNILIFFFKIIFFYFTKPFPWDNNFQYQDFLLVFENFIRILLILNVIKRISNSETAYKFTAFSILILELMWAFGTVNYGTSIRHHFVSLVPLISLSFYKKNNI